MKPFEFGASKLVKITMKETDRRDAQLESASASRRRRATSDFSSVVVRFRTTEKYGVLLYASTLDGKRISVLSVSNKIYSHTRVNSVFILYVNEDVTVFM